MPAFTPRPAGVYAVRVAGCSVSPALPSNRTQMPTQIKMCIHLLPDLDSKTMLKEVMVLRDKLSDILDRLDNPEIKDVLAESGPGSHGDCGGGFFLGGGGCVGYSQVWWYCFWGSAHAVLGWASRGGWARVTARAETSALGDGSPKPLHSESVASSFSHHVEMNRTESRRKGLIRATPHYLPFVCLLGGKSMPKKK